jgi:hypothetical protein
MWTDYELDSTISRTTEPFVLWQAEKGLVAIGKEALAVAIKLGDKHEGHVFHGKAKLLLDTIVETEEGAIGRSVEREVNEPFLMLGNTEEVQRHLSEANNEDLKKMGYENPQGFEVRARDVFGRFFKKGHVHSWQCIDERDGSIFAFPNETNRFDILVLDGSKLVYKTADVVFIADGTKVILKSPKQLVVSTGRKPISIVKPCCPAPP